MTCRSRSGNAEADGFTSRSTTARPTQLSSAMPRVRSLSESDDDYDDFDDGVFDNVSFRWFVHAANQPFGDISNTPT